MAITVASNLTKASGSLPYLLSDFDLKGGYRVLSDLVSRDAIHVAARSVGMLVYVQSESKFYTLVGGTANANWEEWFVTSLVQVGKGLKRNSETQAIEVDRTETDSWYASKSSEENWKAITSNYTAAHKDCLLVDTSSGSVTITLPSSPVLGMKVTFVDGVGTFSQNNLIVSSSDPIMGASEDMVVDIDFHSFSLVFFNATRGWRLIQAG